MFTVQDILAHFKAKTKSLTMMQGFDLKVIKWSACTVELQWWRTNEKNKFLETNFERNEVVDGSIKNDQKKQWKAWSTLSASWKWSLWWTSATEMFKTIKWMKKWSTTFEELKFWLTNQMQIFNFPRNEKTNTSQGASYSATTSGRWRPPNIFAILLKTTKKWTTDDANHEIVEQNLWFVKIRLKNMTNKCCQNFDDDADEEHGKLKFYYDEN